MLTQLLLEDTHFALGLIAALTFLAIFWLHYDSWKVRPNLKELLKWLGFLVLAVAYLFYATLIEQSAFGRSIFGSSSELVSVFLRFCGYSLLVVSHLLDPLQVVPETTGLRSEPIPTTPGQMAGLLTTGMGIGLGLRLPTLVMALGAALLYFRRATVGLERHLRLVAVGFGLITLFELLNFFQLWSGSENVLIARLAAPFGFIWLASQLFLLIALVILIRWVWAYLVTRLRNQLFMILTTATVVIFLLSTVSFTYLLLQNITGESLRNLTTATKVLEYAVNGKKAETAALADSLAQNPRFIAAVTGRSQADLRAATDGYLVAKKQSSLFVTDADGVVLLRGEDPSRAGDSLSNNPLISRALIGESATGLATYDGVLAPVIEIRSVSPIRDSANTVIGTVSVGLRLTSEFVDGVKKSTGLDSAIYVNNIRSATTFVSADGTTRLVGAKEENKAITTKALKQGTLYAGLTNIFNSPYLAVYSPLKDVDNVPIGMFFVGSPATTLLQTAGRSIELTFLMAVILVFLSSIPSYLIARQISKQLH